MKKVVLFTLILCATLMATAQKTTTKATTKTATLPKTPALLMKNLLDSFSYAAGINVANNMKQQGIPLLNTVVMQKAMEDVFNNKPLAMTDQVIADALQRQLEIFAKIKSDADMAAGKAFLEENKKHKEVVTLPSGLQYMVISQNDSMTNKPKAYDTVVVNYIGTFIDGKEFENSYKRGQPGIFTVNVGIIKGWTEILQLMPVGAKWKVFIPSELGFGIAGAGNGAIPPNATVIFEISLEGIKPGTDPNPNK